MSADSRTISPAEILLRNSDEFQWDEDFAADFFILLRTSLPIRYVALRLFTWLVHSNGCAMKDGDWSPAMITITLPECFSSLAFIFLLHTWVGVTPRVVVVSTAFALLLTWPVGWCLPTSGSCKPPGSFLSKLYTNTTSATTMRMTMAMRPAMRSGNAGMGIIVSPVHGELHPTPSLSTPGDSRWATVCNRMHGGAPAAATSTTLASPLKPESWNL